jgi:hypothetical protein
MLRWPALHNASEMMIESALCYFDGIATTLFMKQLLFKFARYKSCFEKQRKSPQFRQRACIF